MCRLICRFTFSPSQLSVEPAVPPPSSCPFAMPLADLLLQYAPLPAVPYHLTHYVPGATPMSTQPVVLGTLVGYLVVIFGIQAIMRNRSPLKLTFLFQVHNVILSAGSALLLALMLEEILPKVWSHGVFYAICNPAVWTEVSRRRMPSQLNVTVDCAPPEDGILLHD